jgi:hypothetical protein
MNCGNTRRRGRAQRDRIEPDVVRPGRHHPDPAEKAEAANTEARSARTEGPRVLPDHRHGDGRRPRPGRQECRDDQTPREKPAASEDAANRRAPFAHGREKATEKAHRNPADATPPGPKAANTKDGTRAEGLKMSLKRKGRPQGRRRRAIGENRGGTGTKEPQFVLFAFQDAAMVPPNPVWRKC